MSWEQLRSSPQKVLKGELLDEIETLKGKLTDLQQRYQKVVNLNVKLMDQLKRQVELNEDLHQRLKDKDGKKELKRTRKHRRRNRYV